jgi:drug/metabolite transporter (DMT)-like permease
VAAGSQLSAAIVLAVPAVIWWPSVAPRTTAWIAAALLAVACTGIAYVLYFRLIAHVGPTNAITVTFLIPGVRRPVGTRVPRRGAHAADDDRAAS